MIGLIRMRRVQGAGQTLVPFVLAVVIAVLGALVYLELVSILIAYAG